MSPPVAPPTRLPPHNGAFADPRPGSQAYPPSVHAGRPGTGGSVSGRVSPMPAVGRQSSEVNGSHYMPPKRPAGALPPRIPGMRDSIEDGRSSSSFMDDLYASAPEYAPKSRPYSPPYGPYSHQTRKFQNQLSWPD